jgi:hypothetical protein
MFYKHWKKFALTLTALFWASCDDSSLTDSPDLYGCPPDACHDEPISSEAGQPESSSSVEASSSSEFMDAPLYGDIPVFEDSADVVCVPTDSSVAYFAQDYSADTQKMWKEEEAKHDAVDKIDSIKQTLTETPMCLEHLRMQLDRFVALYGAPTIIMNAVESCEDGTIQPSEEYANFLRMKAEWEANKPALDEELQKAYEDKLKEIEQRIDMCLNGSDEEGDK